MWWDFNKMISKSHLAQSPHRGASQYKCIEFEIGRAPPPPPSKIHLPYLLMCESPLNMSKIVLQTETRLSNASTGSHSLTYGTWGAQEFAFLLIPQMGLAPGPSTPLWNLCQGIVVHCENAGFFSERRESGTSKAVKGPDLTFKGSLRIAVLIKNSRALRAEAWRQWFGAGDTVACSK